MLLEWTKKRLMKRHTHVTSCYYLVRGLVEG